MFPQPIILFSQVRQHYMNSIYIHMYEICIYIYIYIYISHLCICEFILIRSLLIVDHRKNIYVCKYIFNVVSYTPKTYIHIYLSLYSYLCKCQCHSNASMNISLETSRNVTLEVGLPGCHIK